MGHHRTERLVGAVLVLGVTCCGVGCNRKSSLLLERQALGPMIEEGEIAKTEPWVLDPPMQTKTQQGVEISVTYASRAYLRDFFSNRQVFGSYAGMNPFFEEQIVFYLKLSNHSGKKLRIDPARFVLLDDKGNQYQPIGADYGNALAEAKAPVATLTRGVLEEARPGYFGLGLPVGKIIGRPQQRFALMKMSGFQGGFLYDGVVYDGLLTFWSPHREAQQVKLLLGDIKTDFSPDDFPKASLDFPFEFAAKHNN